MSQRSYSNNSQSANTCSSICSSQPINQHSFRYLDSDMAKKRPLVVSFRHSRANKGQKPFQQYCTNFSCSDSGPIKSAFSNSHINGSSRPVIITPTLKKKKFPQIINFEKELCNELISAYNRRNFDSYENSYENSLRNCPCVDYPDLYPTDTNKYIYPKEKYYGNAKLTNDSIDQKNNQISNNIRNSDNNFDIRNKESSYFPKFTYDDKFNAKNFDTDQTIMKNLNENYLESLKPKTRIKGKLNSMATHATGEKLARRSNEMANEMLNKKSKSLPSLFGFTQ